MATAFQFKKDEYWKARGQHARLLDILCRKCGCAVAVYQKDGPGNLRRLYLDRVLAPKPISGLQTRHLQNIPILKCEKCGEVLGTPHLYEKENRKSFRLYQDAVLRKSRKLKQ